MASDELGHTILFPRNGRPKTNMHSLKIFKKVMEISGLSNAHSPRYPIPQRAMLDLTPIARHLVCLPHEGEETVFLDQVNIDLRFPYCEALVDFYKLFREMSTKITSTGRRSWVGFRIQCRQQGYPCLSAVFSLFLPFAIKHF